MTTENRREERDGFNRVFNFSKQEIKRLKNYPQHEVLPTVSDRFTIWEGRQMIMAEIWEYLNVKFNTSSHQTRDMIKYCTAEAMDIFGYINYFGLKLFVAAVTSITNRRPVFGIAVYSAFLQLQLAEEKDFHGVHVSNFKVFQEDVDLLEEFFKNLKYVNSQAKSQFSLYKKERKAATGSQDSYEFKRLTDQL